MMSPFNNSRYSLGARQIHTMLDHVLEDHFINVVENRIDTITTYPIHDNVYDFKDNCVILPGTVNMYTRLDLSGLPQMTPSPPFHAWLDHLYDFHCQTEHDAHSDTWHALLRPELLAEAVAIADTVRIPFFEPEDMVPKLPIRYRFPELVSWNSDDRPFSFDEFPVGAVTGEFGLALGPPPSIDPELIEKAIQFAKRHSLPISIQLAEFAEEIQFLRSHDGPLLDWLRQHDPTYRPDQVICGSRPLDYLKLLEDAPKVFVVHGNYFEEEELRFLADRRDQFSVVYCPRTHYWFGHRRYPLNRMLDLGVNVLLGTAALCSAYDLSLVSEMQHVMNEFPDIPPETVFRMGTSYGAQALGIQSDYGTIEPGKIARFAFYPS